MTMNEVMTPYEWVADTKNSSNDPPISYNN